MDTITDFESVDKIDLCNVSHYFDSNGDGVVGGVGDTVRDLTWNDVTLESIRGGNIMHVSVWEGDTSWDVSIVVMGETPTEANMLF